jgi:cation:H+ antiporter
VDLLILFIAFVVILIGAELFTNGIEWFGRKLELAEGAVGSVLAAVGTALPETMIPIVAIIFASGEASHAIGIGAILGAPFMLATLAMFVTGVGVLAFVRRRPAGPRMTLDGTVLGADVRWFAIAYGLAVATAFLPPDVTLPRYAVAVVLLLMYGWYVKGHFEADPAVDVEELAPLRFRRLDPAANPGGPDVPRLRIVNIQVIAALALIIVGAVAFVGAVEGIATSFGLDEMLLALVIAPIATELPEKANSIIWVRASKDTLAMGNITGAMVFQSAFPVSVALAFAPEAWSISSGSLLTFGSALIAFASLAVIFWPFRRGGDLTGRRLLIGGAFYLAYLVAVVIALMSGGVGGGAH